MGPRTTVRAPNCEKRLRGEFLGLAPPLVRISRKSVTPKPTSMVHFLVQPLLNRFNTHLEAAMLPGPIFLYYALKGLIFAELPFICSIGPNLAQVSLFLDQT